MVRHIRLHIDALILHGFAPADRYRIAESLQARLTELLANGTCFDDEITSRTIPDADGGAIQVRNAANAAVGEQLAVALHEGFRRWLVR